MGNRNSEVQGVDATIKALKSAERSLRNAVPVVAMAQMLRRAIQKKLLKEGHGRWYRTPVRSKHKTGLTKRWNYYPRPGYTASTLGHPPATPTGNLRRAVHIRYNVDKTAATVGVHGSRGIGALASILEEGANPNIAPRPFVWPTFRAERAHLERLADKRYRRAVLKAQALFNASAQHQRMAA